MRTIYNDIYTLTSDVDWYKNMLGKQAEKKPLKVYLNEIIMALLMIDLNSNE